MDDHTATPDPINLLQSFSDAVPFLASHARGALVYVDSGASEALGRFTSYAQLVALGAVHVCHLDGARERDDAATAARMNEGKPVSRIVVCCTQPLPRAHEHLVHLVQAHSACTSLTILTTVSQEAHEAANLMGTRAYSDYPRILLQDVASADAHAQPPCAVQVVYWPLQPVVLDSSSFVLPAGSTAAAARAHGGMLGWTPRPPIVDADDADEEQQKTLPQGRFPRAVPQQPEQHGDHSSTATQLSVLAHALVGLVAQCGYRCDTYALGHSAHAVAQEIATAAIPSSAAHPVIEQQAALILVDRCADLATPLLLHDAFLPAAAQVLPRRPAGVATSPAHAVDGVWQTADVAVDMRDVLQPREPDNDAGEPHTDAAPARQPLPSQRPILRRVVDPSQPQSGQWWEFLVGRQGKDGVLFVRKWVKEALRQAKLQPCVRSKAGAVTAEELKALAAQLHAHAQQPGAPQAVVTLAQAAAAILESTTDGAPYQIHQAEQHTMLSIATQGVHALNEYLQQLLTGSMRRVLQGDTPEVLHMAFTQVILAYVLEWELTSQEHAGCLDDEAIQAHMEALCTAAQQPPHHTLALPTVRALAAARKNCTELQHLYNPNKANMTSLASMLGAALTTMRPLADLKHAAHSIGGLLRSGLGRFGLHKQPVPGDHGVVFVFFIGGVCMQEVADVRTAVEAAVAAEDKGVTLRVVVGGTVLLNTHHVLDCVVGRLLP